MLAWKAEMNWAASAASPRPLNQTYVTNTFRQLIRKITSQKDISQSDTKNKNNYKDNQNIIEFKNKN